MSASFRRTLLVIATLLALGVVACGIGPKHDDPGAPVVLGDTGSTYDTYKDPFEIGPGGDTSGGVDTATPLATDGEADADATPDGCSDGGADAGADGGCGDASSDALTEGG